MLAIFKTVLILSVFGFGITALLLLLKPVTSKKFPAKWQYYIWILVLFSMVLPVYKLIPAKTVQKIPVIPKNEIIEQDIIQNIQEAPQTVVYSKKTPGNTKETSAVNSHIDLFNVLAYIWFGGMCFYLSIVIIGYGVYIFKKHKKSVALTDNSVLNDVKRELNIKRNIKLKMLPDIKSPMLAGVLFPVIYIPCKDIPKENMRMVLLHELTHYKRKDLLIKWFSLFVNAVHWFNPLSYVLCANISESCEVSCDMAVTENMTDDEKKIYMKTILDMVE